MLKFEELIAKLREQIAVHKKICKAFAENGSKMRASAVNDMFAELTFTIRDYEKANEAPLTINESAFRDSKERALTRQAETIKALADEKTDEPLTSEEQDNLRFNELVYDMTHRLTGCNLTYERAEELLRAVTEMVGTCTVANPGPDWLEVKITHHQNSEAAKNEAFKSAIAHGIKLAKRADDPIVVPKR